MVKKAIVLAVALAGLGTFFLPLVRVRAPMVGDQRISGWDVVKPGEEKKPRRDDLGLNDALDKIQGDFLRKQRREAPLAYLSLVAGAALALLRKDRALSVTAAVGLLAGVYSVISVYWLSGGLKAMVAGSSGSRIPIFGGLRKKVAEQVMVNPELGLYLLAAALAALLLASFLPSGKRA
ncbi:MAG: hypothetical protein A2620_00050 [Acidobacteria bacterium RIFCSPHIGHO2_01_FULL_67_28]|nr:MAG: hypothetical protein A2620_00050 [Acidobacteria bacterium RIFCSPHIGHO2_01_FULL_67_28]